MEDTRAFDSKLPFGELVRAEAFSFSRFARRLIFQLNLDLVDDASQIEIPQRSKVIQSFRRKFNALHAATKGTGEARKGELSIHPVAINNTTRRMANHARLVAEEVLRSRQTKAEKMSDRQGVVIDGGLLSNKSCCRSESRFIGQHSKTSKMTWKRSNITTRLPHS